MIKKLPKVTFFLSLAMWLLFNTFILNIITIILSFVGWIIARKEHMQKWRYLNFGVFIIHIIGLLLLLV